MRVNFKGIYKISLPRANKEELLDIKQMAKLGNAEVVISSPFAEDTPDIVEMAPVMKGLSLDWLKNNFEKNGNSFPRCFNDSVDVFLFTGKDANEYRKAFKTKQIQTENGMVSAIKHFVEQAKFNYGRDDINKLVGYLGFISSQEKHFDDYLAGKKVQPMLDALT